MLGLSAADVRHLQPLPKQVLTEEDERRRQNLGNNGDRIDPNIWGQWTSSVTNRKATAEEVLGGMRESRPIMEQAAE
jgi:catalase